MSFKKGSKHSLSRITVDLPKKSHRRLKAMAAAHGKSMREVITVLIDGLINESIYVDVCGAHTPNAVTKKAIQDTKDGKGLVKAKDAHDLFKKLGI